MHVRNAYTYASAVLSCCCLCLRSFYEPQCAVIGYSHSVVTPAPLRDRVCLCYCRMLFEWAVRIAPESGDGIGYLWQVLLV
jgi:hypothetical protein